MKNLLTASLVLLSMPTFAEVISLSANNGESSVEVKNVQARGSYVHEVRFNIAKIDAVAFPSHPEFKMLSEKNLAFSQTVGEARLPFKSLVVVGRPQDIKVTIDSRDAVEVSLLSSPAQEEDCRCEVQKAKKWISKSAQNGFYKVESLGKYRGQDLSRVTIYAAESDYSAGVTRFYPNLTAQVESSASLKSIMTDKIVSEYDYLIISPESLIESLNEFVQFKTAQGLKVKVTRLEDIGAATDKINTYIKSEYSVNQFKYALLVGTDLLLPNYNVKTSGSSKTPSDYPYFLMDTADMVPDVQYGRVVASTPEEVVRQTKKWMDYQDRSSEASQYLHMIGIASNEGSAPSDNEYVKGMEADLNAKFNTTASHFYQDDTTSKPANINQAFNAGAGWLIYLGHGSGTSWGSTGTSYTNTHVKQMDNAHVLKPVIIDVACQNGILRKGYFGETFLNATNASGEAIGAAMYLGGSVNISWHPPAIMARGMVKRSIEQNLDQIGDVYFQGQLYLLENHTDVEAVRDNWEWYHLFGDASSKVYFQ